MPKGAALLPSGTGGRWTDFDVTVSEFAFKSDADAGRARLRRRNFVKLGIVFVASLLMSTSVFVVWPNAARSDAFLTVESDPPGAEVRVDGQLRGRTPLEMTLTAGTYGVAVGERATAKERRVTLAESERASVQYVLTAPAAAQTSTPPAGPSPGALSVVTQPAPGKVVVDGGAAPLVERDLRPGVHRSNRAPSTLKAGWISVQAPLRLQVHKGGALIGSTEVERLSLPTGDHELTFSDPETGFTTTQRVRVASGSTTGIVVQIPRAPVNVNAIPWAEVSIDNEPVGETPIGNHMLPLGNHEIELRHPQLGTKRVRIAVSLDGPNRVAVNMREP